MDGSTLAMLGIGIAIGLVAGAAAVMAWMKLGPGAGDASARKREQAYREEVAEHFVKTAELVNRLTDSYKEVFDHLRKGAGTLVDEDTLRQRLAHEEDKDVTLHLIGYREPGKGRTAAERQSPRGARPDTRESGSKKPNEENQ